LAAAYAFYIAKAHAFIAGNSRTAVEVRKLYESGDKPGLGRLGVRHPRIPALTGANGHASINVETPSVPLDWNFGRSILRSGFSSPVRLSTADDAETISNCAFCGLGRFTAGVNLPE